MQDLDHRPFHSLAMAVPLSLTLERAPGSRKSQNTRRADNRGTVAQPLPIDVPRIPQNKETKVNIPKSLIVRQGRE